MLLAQFEISDSLRRNLDCLAGFWIASPARASLAVTETAKAAQLDLLAGIERLHDAVQDRLDHHFGVWSGQAACLGNVGH